MASVFKRGGRGNRGGKWYVQWYDHTGKRRSKSAGTTDRATAERIAAKLEAEVALRRERVVDPRTEVIQRESERTVEERLNNYHEKLRSLSRSEKYIRETLKYIRAIAGESGWETVGDIKAEEVNSFTSRLNEEGKSARTVGAYITAIKGFTRWLSQRTQRDPLASAKKPNPEKDRRHERRFLTTEEWIVLRRETEGSDEKWGMTGSERALLYAVAVQTGLRSRELRSLTRGRLYLDVKCPYVTCKPASTKNAKEARPYIQTDVAAALAELIARKSPKSPVFRMPHSGNVAHMLRDDLDAARERWIGAAKNDPKKYSERLESDFLCYRNHDGEVLDFHALRHTCGVWLALAGASPKAIQTIMRHSSITLTLDTYGHLIKGEEANSVAQLPRMMTQARQLAATGTEDTPISALHQAQQSGRETMHLDAKACEETEELGGAERVAKTSENAGENGILRVSAMPDEQAGPLGFEPRLTDPESVVLPLH